MEKAVAHYVAALQRIVQNILDSVRDRLPEGFRIWFGRDEGWSQQREFYAGIMIYTEAFTYKNFGKSSAIGRDPSHFWAA
jgi:hypothetical protein